MKNIKLEAGHDGRWKAVKMQTGSKIRRYQLIYKTVVDFFFLPDISECVYKHINIYDQILELLYYNDHVNTKIRYPLTEKGRCSITRNPINTPRFLHILALFSYRVHTFYSSFLYVFKSAYVHNTAVKF